MLSCCKNTLKKSNQSYKKVKIHDDGEFDKQKNKNKLPRIVKSSAISLKNKIWSKTKSFLYKNKYENQINELNKQIYFDKVIQNDLEHEIKNLKMINKSLKNKLCLSKSLIKVPYNIGDLVDVKNKLNRWNMGEVLSINKNKVCIHYCGAMKLTTEWIRSDSDRLASLGRYTASILRNLQRTKSLNFLFSNVEKMIEKKDLEIHNWYDILGDDGCWLCGIILEIHEEYLLINYADDKNVNKMKLENLRIAPICKYTALILLYQ